MLRVLLSALGEHLASSGTEPVELVVCGGTAMNVLGFVQRPTQDVDVVALLNPTGTFQLASPLPEHVVAAKSNVAADFELPEDWLNDGPASLLHFGLPEGSEGRLIRHEFGSGLTVHFLAREDLICLKLYAWADTGAVRHGQDLRALAPTREEWRRAAQWVLTHNEPEGFLPLLVRALELLGANDVAAELG
jgi:hypothetical protein